MRDSCRKRNLGLLSRISALRDTIVTLSRSFIAKDLTLNTLGEYFVVSAAPNDASRESVRADHIAVWMSDALCAE